MLPIPPAFAFTLAAIGVAALAKALVTEWRRVNEELEARERGMERAEDIPKLRRDSSGVFRPE